MLSGLNKKLQIIRDIAVLGISGFLILAGYHNTLAFTSMEEPVFYVLFAMGSVLALLTVINLIVLKKHDRSRYFYFNSGFQLIPFFILAGLTGILGVVFFILNILVLITLRKKKN